MTHVMMCYFICMNGCPILNVLLTFCINGRTTYHVPGKMFCNSSIIYSIRKGMDYDTINVCFEKIYDMFLNSEICFPNIKDIIH